MKYSYNKVEKINKIIQKITEKDKLRPIFSREKIALAFPEEMQKKAFSWKYGIKPVYLEKKTQKVFYTRKDVINWLQKEIQND